MVDLPGLARSQKRIVRFPGWSPPEDETGYLAFSAPLVIGDIVEEGFNLEGGCFRQNRDVNVCFELVLGKSPTRKRTPIERIEWRSLKGGHSNKRNKPPGLVRRTGADHIHRFDLNYLKTEMRMRGDNLPLADNFSEVVESFEGLLQYAGRTFNISNIDVVKRPDWDYGLFDDPPRFPAGS